jgi:hypothetical protein
MADFSKVVDKLTETNKSLAALEAQGIADNGIKSIIAQSLPEVLNERNLAKKREIFDKDTKITEVDDRVEDNTKAIITLTDEQKETNNILNNQPEPENTAKTFGETFQDLGFKEAITQLGKNVLRSIVSPGKKEEEEKKKDKKDSKILVGLKSVGGALKNFGKNTLDKLVTKPAKGLFGVIKGLAAALGLVFLSRFFLSDAFPKFVTYLTDKLPRDFTGLTTSLDDITSGIVELAKGIPELTKSIKEFKLFGDGEDGESFLSKFKFAIGAGAAALSGALLSGASKVSSKISKFVSGMTVKDPTNLSKKDKIAIKVANSANKVAKPLAIVGSFLKGLPFISSLISGGFGVTEALNPETRFKGIGRIAGLGVGASAAALLSAGTFGLAAPIAAMIPLATGEIGASIGKMFDPKKIIEMAEGGSVGTGQPYVVGERGQELFVPNQPGQIVNAQRTAQIMKGNPTAGTTPINIVHTPIANSSVTNTSNNTSTVSYIGNPDPIFQRSSSYAI